MFSSFFCWLGNMGDMGYVGDVDGAREEFYQVLMYGRGNFTEILIYVHLYFF